MASSTLRQCLCLLSFLTMIHVCLSTSISKEKLVTLDVYYESLCPGCEGFVTNELPTIFINRIIDIVQLRLFPWGNAVLTSSHSFTCQHGEPECFLNTVEACAIDRLQMVDYFLFITCVERKARQGKDKWKTCYNETGLDEKTLTNCIKSGHGKKLELRYAANTSALNPPHEFVPWVVVDGKPLGDDYPNFISYICKAYKGPLPSACKKKFFASVSSEKTKQVDHVCYRDQTTKEPYHYSL